MKRYSILLDTRKIKIKIIVKYPTHPPRWLKLFNRPPVSKVIEQLKLSHTAGGCVNQYNNFGNLLTVSFLKMNLCIHYNGSNFTPTERHIHMTPKVQKFILNWK